MRIHPIIIAMVAVLLGCSPSAKPPVYADWQQASLPPPAGMAQLILYYPHSVFWKGNIVDINLNGKKGCDLESGSFATQNVPPSAKTTLIVSPCGGLESSHLTLVTEPGQRYYIRIVPGDNALVELIARANLSEPAQPRAISFEAPVPALPKDPSNNDKKKSTEPAVVPEEPFFIDRMNEPAALKELQALHPCPRCTPGVMSASDQNH